MSVIGHRKSPYPDMNPDETHYFASWQRIGLAGHLLHGFMALIGASIFAIYLIEGKLDANRMFAAMFFISIALLPYTINHYRRSNPTIVFAVNHQGLWLRHLKAVVPWAKIKSLRIRHIKVEATHLIFIVVDVPDQSVIRPRWRWLFKINAVLDSVFGRPPLSFALSSLHEPPDVVVAAIEKYHPVEGSL